MHKINNAAFCKRIEQNINKKQAVKIGMQFWLFKIAKKEIKVLHLNY